MEEVVEKKKRSTVSRAKDAEIERLRDCVEGLENSNGEAEKCIKRLARANRLIALIIAFESVAITALSVAIVMLVKR